MEKRTPNDEARFRELRTSYDAAFRQWFARVHIWQSFARQSGSVSAAMREAQTQMEAAQTVYRKRRDALADLMLTWPSRTAASGRQHRAGALTAKEAAPEGQTVSFDVERGEKGTQAVNVRSQWEQGLS